MWIFVSFGVDLKAFGVEIFLFRKFSSFDSHVIAADFLNAAFDHAFLFV
jgi:hypothetical protein